MKPVAAGLRPQEPLEWRLAEKSARAVLLRRLRRREQKSQRRSPYPGPAFPLPRVVFRAALDSPSAQLAQLEARRPPNLEAGLALKSLVRGWQPAFV